ncbi:MAG TPA: SPFH domain-containing protein [Kofleriaceae bacterium]|jgi:regulator of protease activity HflC (stomatin/prohibitin superfamily)|nr:SPFH domain-containing protein [Kofleriaceae bacterium]
MSSFVLGLIIGTAIVAVYLFVRSGFRVDNGNIGALTVFGKFVRGANGAVRTYGPGLSWKAPWAQAIEVSLAERSLSVAETGSSIEALAADGTRVRVNARLRYRVSPLHLARFLAEAKDAPEHLRTLFRLTVREQIPRFEQQPSELSAYTALRLHMNELQQRTLDAMREAAAEEYGVEVIAVDYLQLDPPEELVDALNAVITAESEADALVARTELTAQQRVLAAEQAVAIANAHALATESEILTVGAELATLAEQGVLCDYVDRRRLEVLGGSRRIYLNHTTTLRS